LLLLLLLLLLGQQELRLELRLKLLLLLLLLLLQDDGQRGLLGEQGLLGGLGAELLAVEGLPLAAAGPPALAAVVGAGTRP